MWKKNNKTYLPKPLAGKKSSTATSNNIKPPVTVISNVLVYSPIVLQRGKSQMTSGKSLVKDKKKKAAFPPAFSEDKMAGDDEINDVAAMDGLNLAEESQRISGSTELIGQQIRSCKDENLVSKNLIHRKLLGFATKHNLEEPSEDVSALLSHALQEYLKNIIEKLVDISQHRVKFSGEVDNRFEITQDVKSQLKFLEDVDRVNKKRRENSEREMLISVAKSRSTNENPEQAQLKAKAKEMLRADMEKLRRRKTDMTALQAIGPHKRPRFEGAAEQASVGAEDQAYSGQSQMALQSRIKRINHRDMLCLLEQYRDPRISMILYRAYLK